MSDNQEQKDQNESSVLGDIIKQTTKDILKPKALEVANSAITDIIYAVGDWLVGIVGKKIFGPDSQYRTGRSGNKRGTDYNKLSQSNTNIGLRASDDLMEVIFSTESEAVDVRNEMIDRIRRYGKVSVGFLYEKAHKQPISSDYRYGWTDERDIHYTRNRFGFYFDLPKPRPIA